MDNLTNNFESNDIGFDSDVRKNVLNILNLSTNQTTNYPKDVNSILDSAYPGYSSDDIMKIENGFTNLEIMYNNTTDVLQIGNDLGNVNNFVKNTYDLENKRLNSVLDHSVNDVYLSRETYMLTKYNIAYQVFLTNVILVSMFFAIILFFIASFTFYEPIMLSWKVAGVIIGFILVLYLLVVLMMYKSLKRRRKDDWTKFYFDTPYNNKPKSCPN